MSVETVLNKLRDHNDGVIGCLATHGDASYHNFKDPYEVVDAATVGEEAQQMFELMDTLSNPETRFDEVFLEMNQHSVFAHRLEDGVLVVLNKRVDRSVFRRLKVGVNLFVKPLKRMLDDPDAPPPGGDTPKKEVKKQRFYRGVAY